MAAAVCTYPQTPCGAWDHAIMRCVPCLVAYMRTHPAPGMILFSALRSSASIEFFESVLDVMIDERNKDVNYVYDFEVDLEYPLREPVFLKCGQRRATMLHYALCWLRHLGTQVFGFQRFTRLQKQQAIIERIELLVERGATFEFDCGCTVDSLLEPLKGSESYDKCCVVLGGGSATKSARRSRESTNVASRRLE